MGQIDNDWIGLTGKVETILVVKDVSTTLGWIFGGNQCDKYDRLT